MVQLQLVAVDLSLAYGVPGQVKCIVDNRNVMESYSCLVLEAMRSGLSWAGKR